MRKLVMVILLVLLLPAVSVSAEEISVSEQPLTIPSHGYEMIVSAGTIGVGASAGLLLLSNRR